MTLTTISRPATRARDTAAVTMKAFVYRGPARKPLKSVQSRKSLRPIVKIVKTTICGTDLRILKGDVPRTTARSTRAFGTAGWGVIFRSASARKAKTRMVEFGHATEKVAGFLALPRDQRRHRAIIVVHEWWGLNEWVKEQAENAASRDRVGAQSASSRRYISANPMDEGSRRRHWRDNVRGITSIYSMKTSRYVPTPTAPWTFYIRYRR
jgi:hypothetical protein